MISNIFEFNKDEWLQKVSFTFVDGVKLTSGRTVKIPSYTYASYNY